LGSGWYKVNLAATDVNGDFIALKFTATGADQRSIGTHHGTMILDQDFQSRQIGGRSYFSAVTPIQNLSTLPPPPPVVRNLYCGSSRPIMVRPG
jgi:hypothetical protein